MDKSISILRHDARGCLNSMKLCVTALELPCTHEEQLEFIGDVVRSASRLEELAEELVAHFDAAGSPTNTH